MPIHIVRPVANIDLADTEHRLRGICGARISPTMSGITLHNFAREKLNYDYRDMVLRQVYAITTGDRDLGLGYLLTVPISNIPDLPLLYPSIQVAFSKTLVKADIERLSLSSGRVSGKSHVYNLLQPTISKIQSVSRAQNILPGWRAPAGYASINSFRACILVRRLQYAFICAQDNELAEGVEEFLLLAESYSNTMPLPEVNDSTVRACHLRIQVSDCQ